MSSIKHKNMVEYAEHAQFVSNCDTLTYVSERKQWRDLDKIMFSFPVKSTFTSETKQDLHLMCL